MNDWLLCVAVAAKSIGIRVGIPYLMMWKQTCRFSAAAPSSSHHSFQVLHVTQILQ